MFAVWGEGDAVGLDEGVVYDCRLARLGVEAVGGGAELGWGVGQAVEPGVLRVGEPDVAVAVHDQVVDAIEVEPVVVVQEGDGLVGFWVEGSEADALFAAADGAVAA